MSNKNQLINSSGQWLSILIRKLKQHIKVLEGTGNYPEKEKDMLLLENLLEDLQLENLQLENLHLAQKKEVRWIWKIKK